MLIHWIWFATRHMGDHIKLALLSHFNDPEAIYYAQKGELDGVEYLSKEGRERLADKSLAKAQKIINDCTNLKIRILTFQDAAYPGRLKNIPDPPMVLYYKGQLPDFDNEPVIGVVGTRKASPYGMTVAKRMGYQIAASGGIVVSGLASGIDSMAMKGALTAGKTVVGVLGCGADVIYPPGNKSLFADTEQYGCILSEFVPGTEPLSWNFPRRNRIISGLSCGVLVVEAPAKSGALITARKAADQGRDVFVVPSNIDVPTGQGSNALLRDGAIPVSSGWDILSEYACQFPGRLRPAGQDARMEAYPDELEQVEKTAPKVAQRNKKPEKAAAVKTSTAKKVIDKAEKEPYIDLTKIDSSLTHNEKAVVELLSGGQRLVDEVIAQSGKRPGEVLATLTLLEVKGIIRRLPGRYVALSGGK